MSEGTNYITESLILLGKNLLLTLIFLHIPKANEKPFTFVL